MTTRGGPTPRASAAARTSASASAQTVPRGKARKVNAAPGGATPLRSRGVIVFAGLSYLFTGFAFAYVDRSYRAFGFACVLWLMWAALGFGAGVFNQRRPEGAGRTQWKLMGVFGFVLAVFPGVLLFAFPRWVCLVLLIVMGARAAQLRTQRDLYLTMTVIVTVCFMTTTHYAADWSLWFYVGPAWLFGALALAWLHAEGVRLSRWTKLSMTTGFVAVSFALAALLFLFAPRPPVLGFGFLPGGDTPGLLDPPSGNRSDPDGDRNAREQGGQGSSGNSGTSGAGGWGGSSGQGSSRPQRGAPPSQWDRMLDSMRDAGKDPFAPQWQRGAINGALDAAQALRNWWKGEGSPGAAGADGESGASAQQPPSDSGGGISLLDLLLWLACVLLAWLLWRRRYRWGVRAALAGAWGLSRWFPAQSMQLSARAMTWCLRSHRHLPLRGQSVREHWSSAKGLAPLAHTWLNQALENYCAMRFGGLPVTQKRALRLREDVLGATEVMSGAVPELSR